ncbi:lactonase family protein [Cellulomonas sp. URHB0016]
MHRLTRSGAVVAVATALVIAATPAFASTSSRGGRGHQSVVYVPTNDAAGNEVRVLTRAPDGTLQAAGSYATDGTGGALTGAVVDRLASQGSVVLDRPAGLLYVVNAGSDTLSVFRVAGTELRLREVVPSGGDFPVSVAVHDGRVYVLNARGGGSVQGYVRHRDRLVPVGSWHRDLGLDPTATPEFTHTPGQVAFGPDGRTLLVTTKAATNAIDVFTFDRFGGPSATPTVTTVPGRVPFGLVLDGFGHVVVAEAPNVVATFALGSDGTLTVLSEQATGQAATCWIAASGADVWASNAGSATVSGFRIDGPGALTATGVTPTLPGTVDASVSSDGRFLDVQTGAQGTVDTYAIGVDGTLTSVGSVVVPGTIGGEGIASS